MKALELQRFFNNNYDRYDDDHKEYVMTEETFLKVVDKILIEQHERTKRNILNAIEWDKQFTKNFYSRDVILIGVRNQVLCAKMDEEDDEYEKLKQWL